MKPLKQVLRPERVRTAPEQFSWVDQALVQHHLIDRCSSPSAALYLFLITVADHQGLSYYAAATLASRLHLSEAEQVKAHQRHHCISQHAQRARQTFEFIPAP